MTFRKLQKGRKSSLIKENMQKFGKEKTGIHGQELP